MFDKKLVSSILRQVDEALEKIKSRSEQIHTANDFTNSPFGMEKLDGICMLFVSIGEALKNINKITGASLLSQYPEIDWKGVMGFRDIIAHQYFDIDAEEVFWICTHEVAILSATVKKMISSLQ